MELDKTMIALIGLIVICILFGVLGLIELASVALGAIVGVLVPSNVGSSNGSA